MMTAEDYAGYFLFLGWKTYVNIHANYTFPRVGYVRGDKLLEVLMNNL